MNTKIIVFALFFLVLSVGKASATCTTVIGSWELENALTDSSGNGRSLAQVGSSMAYVSGVNGTAASIVVNNTNTLRLADNASFEITNGSICLWFKMNITMNSTGSLGEAPIIWIKDNEYTGLHWNATGGQLRWRMYNGTPNDLFSYENTWANNTWYFICGVWNDTSGRLLYVNGNTNGTDAHKKGWTDTADAWDFGAGSTIGKNTLMTYDDIRWYSCSLSQAEVQAIYNAVLTGGGEYTPISQAITSPENTTYASSSVNINGTCNANCNSTYSLDGAGNVSIANSTATFSTAMTSLGSGGHNVYICSTNSSNASETDCDKIYFTVDTPAGVVLNYPNDAASLTVGAIQFNYTPTDNIGFQKAELFLNGTNYGKVIAFNELLDTNISYNMLACYGNVIPTNESNEVLRIYTQYGANDSDFPMGVIRFNLTSNAVISTNITINYSMYDFDLFAAPIKLGDSYYILLGAYNLTTGLYSADMYNSSDGINFVHVMNTTPWVANYVQPFPYKVSNEVMWIYTSYNNGSWIMQRKTFNRTSGVVNDTTNLFVESNLVGYPYVIKFGDFYYMYYSLINTDLRVRHSSDGITWSSATILINTEGADSYYRGVIKINNNFYIFSSGNNRKAAMVWNSTTPNGTFTLLQTLEPESASVVRAPHAFYFSNKIYLGYGFDIGTNDHRLSIWNMTMESDTESWAANATNATAITNGTVNTITVPMSVGIYKWNVGVTDSYGSVSWMATNWTVIISEVSDTTPPDITISTPLNQTYNQASNGIYLNWSMSDTMNETATAASFNGGANLTTNVTMQENSSFKSYNCGGAESFDGDWSTYELWVCYNTLAYAYLNYTKYSNAISATWQVKEACTISDETPTWVPVTSNLTITSNCFSRNPIQLRIQLYTDGTAWPITTHPWELNYSCYNGSDWYELREVNTTLTEPLQTTACRVYEEAVFWTVENYNNITLSASDGVNNVTIYAVDTSNYRNTTTRYFTYWYWGNISVRSPSNELNWSYSKLAGATEQFNLTVNASGTDASHVNFTIPALDGNFTLVASNKTINSSDGNVKALMNLTSNASLAVGTYMFNITWTQIETGATGTIEVTATIAPLAGHANFNTATFSIAKTVSATSSNVALNMSNTGNYNLTGCNLSISSTLSPAAHFANSSFTITNTTNIISSFNITGGNQGTDNSASIILTCVATATGGLSIDILTGSIAITADSSDGGGGGHVESPKGCGSYDITPSVGFSGSSPIGKKITPPFILNIYNGNISQKYYASFSDEIKDLCTVLEQPEIKTPVNGIDKIIFECFTTNGTITGNVIIETDTGCEDARPVTLVNSFGIIADIEQVINKIVGGDFTGAVVVTTDLGGWLIPTIIIMVIVIVLLILGFLFIFDV